MSRVFQGLVLAVGDGLQGGVGKAGLGEHGPRHQPRLRVLDFPVVIRVRVADEAEHLLEEAADVGLIVEGAAGEDQHQPVRVQPGVPGPGV